MKVDAALVHIPRLRRYARALAGDAALADDLVQDTLERACQKWALWQPPAAASAEQVQKALLSWLLTRALARTGVLHRFAAGREF